jgi:type IV pilus assembly protein PilN
MIRINLLPFRAARKRENVRQQISIFVLIIIFSLLGLGYYYMKLTSEVSQLKEEEKTITADLATYKKELNEIKDLEKKIKEIKTKLGVIKDLEKGKTGPVLLLADVATAVPVDKLWLTAFTESKGTLTLTGTAMDNETVALFMENLKSTEHITAVDLERTTTRDIPEFRLKVADFALKCKTYAYGK